MTEFFDKIKMRVLLCLLFCVQNSAFGKQVETITLIRNAAEDVRKPDTCRLSSYNYTFQDGDQMEIKTKFYMNKASCIITNKSVEILNKSNFQEDGNSNGNNWMTKSPINVTKDIEGFWNCKFYTDRQDPYYNFECSFRLDVIGLVPENREEEEQSSRPYWIWITISVAILFGIVIIAQTVILLHFRAKARGVTANTNKRHMSLETIKPKNDRNRYSSLPELRLNKTANKLSREERNSGSAIYESLDIVREAAKNIVDRPPMPIPIEANSEEVSIHQQSLDRKELLTKMKQSRFVTNTEQTKEVQNALSRKEYLPNPIPPRETLRTKKTTEFPKHQKTPPPLPSTKPKRSSRIPDWFSRKYNAAEPPVIREPKPVVTPPVVLPKTTPVSPNVLAELDKQLQKRKNANVSHPVAPNTKPLSPVHTSRRPPPKPDQSPVLEGKHNAQFLTKLQRPKQMNPLIQPPIPVRLHASPQLPHHPPSVPSPTPSRFPVSQLQHTVPSDDTARRSEDDEWIYEKLPQYNIYNI